MEKRNRRGKYRELTQELLKEVLRYEPETGYFFSRAGRTPDPVGSINRWGYRLIWVAGKTYGAHRLAWLYVNGNLPELQIDHINGDQDDNRIENLRIASFAENMRNVKKRAGTSSQFKGVTWKADNGNWQASIRVEGQKHQKYLGRFKSEQEAAHAYNKAAIKYFGDFAVLNPVGIDNPGAAIAASAKEKK